MFPKLLEKAKPSKKTQLKKKNKEKIKWGKRRPNMSYGKIFNQDTLIIHTEWLTKAKNSTVINS